MIGYYVHHVGSGHLDRARVVAREISLPVVGLSSLPRPPDWPGDWVQLARDDPGDERDRMSALSAWILRSGPSLVVAAASSEVAVLAKLHGVPVVSTVLPGRSEDEDHLLGYGVSTALVAAWPAAATAMLPGLPRRMAARVQHVGAISRFPVAAPRDERRAGPWRVTVLLGPGGDSQSATALDQARATTPGWEWSVLGRDEGWSADPFAVLCDADVVVCRAGQASIADVAAARRPAMVVPAAHRHEQWITARTLEAGGWPVRVEAGFPRSDWASHLHAVRLMDGRGWAGWCDGRAAGRMAAVLIGEHNRKPVVASV